MRCPIPAIAILCFACLTAFSSFTPVDAGVEPGENLLENSRFEQPLDRGWEKRTPDDGQRKLELAPGRGREGGAAVVLRNLEPVYTRLRQGADGSLVVEAGSRLELRAWVKSTLAEGGAATVQIYCMDADGGILAQPTSPAVGGPCDWTQLRTWVVVPERTAYVMAYLQIRDAAGEALFDEVELVVRGREEPLPPAPKVALVTDLVDGSPHLRELHALFEGLERIDHVGDAPTMSAWGFAGAVVFFESAVPQAVLPRVAEFARSGGRVFMDIRSFAQWQGVQTQAVQVGIVEHRPVEEQMAAGVRIVKIAEPTAGFEVGQTMPRAGWPDGRLFVLPADFEAEGLEVLAAAPSGEPAIVNLVLGKGKVTAADVLSLREPHFRHVDAYYKYTPVAAAMGNPVRFGQWYPRRFTYGELVEEMRQIAREHPAIEFREEGPACGGHKLYSLNLGNPKGPLYFLYAAAHGSEWEPGYGLLTFARRLAEGRLADAVDLGAVRVKIVPIINPSGYEAMRRQNDNGVDLNRQGDYRATEFEGRDSNGDGRYGPFDYDWKGDAPFTEPEARTYKSIVEDPALHCVLDFHGNGSAKSNKVAVLPAVADSENDYRAMRLQRIANACLRGRHLLRQLDEDAPSQYLLDHVRPGGNVPYLMNTSARDRFGLLIELTAGYRSSYGTVLQTDVTCELCRALFVAYPPPDRK